MRQSLKSVVAHSPFRIQSLGEILWDVERLSIWLCSSVKVVQLLSYLYITPLCYGTKNDFGLPDWCQGGISIRGENIFFLVHTFQWQQNLIVFFTVLNWTWQSARSSPLGDGSMDSFLLFRWENWTVFLKASEAGVRS